MTHEALPPLHTLRREPDISHSVSAASIKNADRDRFSPRTPWGGGLTSARRRHAGLAYLENIARGSAGFVAGEGPSTP